MEIKKIKAKLREANGTGANRRLRKQGFIPAVVYAKDFPAIAIELEADDFVHAAERSYTSQVFELVSESAEINGKQVIVKDIQREYLKNAVLHVDFQVLAEGTSVTVKVPLNVFGEARGVKEQGGVLTVSCRNVALSCLPGAIPEIIDIDITPLKLGERIRTGDIELPEGVKLAGNPMETIANIISGRLSRLAAAEEGAAEAAATEAPAAA